MGLTGMVFSFIAAAAGAIMYWGVTSQGTGFRISTVGVILMIVGGVGFVVSAIVFGTSRRQKGGGGHTLDRETTDAQGRTTELHEQVK
jgi:hypothetical protein